MFRDYFINRLYLQKVNLKKPLSRGSRIKIYFRLECRENRGLRQNFHGIFFSKDRVLIKPDHRNIPLSDYMLSNKNKQFTFKHECKKHNYEN